VTRVSIVSSGTIARLRLEGATTQCPRAQLHSAPRQNLGALAILGLRRFPGGCADGRSDPQTGMAEPTSVEEAMQRWVYRLFGDDMGTLHNLCADPFIPPSMTFADWRPSQCLTQHNLGQTSKGRWLTCIACLGMTWWIQLPSA
jgi:hypothetical protein